MKILTVDDEAYALSSIEHAVLQVLPEAELRSFSSPAAAIEEIKENGYMPDVAFLDIRMPGITGLEMAKLIRETSPHTNIIFVTAYSDYMPDAFSIHSSGYLMKPVTAENVRAELDDLRHPVVQSADPATLRVCCFGNFEVFMDDRPLHFNYSKTKELFAYLIDRRGAAINTAELCATLWEDQSDVHAQRAYLRKLISDLSHTLSDIGAEDVFIKDRNSFSISTDKVDCDYYRMLRKDVAAINTYTGEYMTQYSWAEITLGTLENDKL